MSKVKKIVIGTLGFLVLAAGIVAGTYLVSKNQDIREKAAPSTSLSFFPTVVTKNPGQTFNLTINADTGTNKITGVDIEISYDPNSIELTSMDPTSAISPLSSVIKDGLIDNAAGTARFAAFTVLKADAVSGNLDMINMVGKIKSNASNGQYPITFTATTTFSAVDEGLNVIINSTPATVTVTTGSGATATATATSASGIGATATATSRATATATSRATATATSAGGIGGAGLKTATPTATATSKASAAGGATVSPTVPPDLPVTGISIPFFGGAILGIGAIVLSLFLAF